MKRLKEEKIFDCPPVGRWVVLAACLLCLWAERASALGTPAGTTIANTATVAYTLGGDPTPLTVSASNTFDVLEIIDATLTWQDAANVPVDTPQANAALSLLLTNTGNGPEDFRLVANATLGSDQFDPGNVAIWIESNATPGFQSDDSTYPAAGITLNADESLLVYVVGDIPAGLANGAVGTAELIAQAQTAGAAGQAPGTRIASAGFNNVDAVVGTTGARGSAIAAYEVFGVTVALTKSVVAIDDGRGGDRPFPGARVSYRIEVRVEGNGTAQGLVIADPISSHMTFVVGSITLDGNGQTAAADGDFSDYNITAADTLTVDLSDTVAPATHIIEFSTTIN